MKLITAEEARKNTMDFIINGSGILERAMNEIDKQSKHGSRNGYLWDQSSSEIRKVIIEKLTDLGYEVEIHPTAIRFSW